MNVAILYLNTGVGHFRESLAIADSLTENKKIKVDLINPAEKIAASPDFFARLVSGGTGLIVKSSAFITSNFPTLGTAQKALDIGFDNRIKILSNIFSTCRWVEIKLGRIFKDILNLNSYDIVISTHPEASGLALGALGEKYKYKLLNICPDEVGVSAASFYKVDGITTQVNSGFAKKAFRNLGIKDALLDISGHPLDPKIFNSRKKIFDRVQNDLSRGKLTLGLYIGGFGPKKQKDALLEVIRELKDEIREGKIKIKAITGKHADYKKSLKNTLKELGINKIVEVYNTKSFKEIVKVGHDFMLHDIDVMFSRPSELVFYSLATGIPHILFQPVGPQEIDMWGLLRKHAKVNWHSDLKGKLAKYVFDKHKMVALSNGLFNSGYNLEGSFNLAKKAIR